MDNKSSTGISAVGTGNGNDAFEAYQSGASVEEINERFFSAGGAVEAEASTPHQSANQTASSPGGSLTDDSSFDGSQTDVKSFDNTDESNHNSSSETAVPESGSDDSESESVLQADSAGNGDSSDKGEGTDVASGDVKLFSQAELDSIVGRRIDKERRMRGSVENEYDAFASDVARFLGVSKDDVRNEIKKAQIIKDADNENVSDVDLYERARLAEIERDRFKADLERKNEEDARRAFADTMSGQIADFEKKHPDVDVVSVSGNDEFNEALRYFYSKESTKDRCFELAFAALGGNVPLKKASFVKSDDAEKKKAIVESNKQRASESASVSRSPSSADKKFDFSKMSSSDFDEIMERVKNGEVIMP